MVWIGLAVGPGCGGGGSGASAVEAEGGQDAGTGVDGAALPGADGATLVAYADASFDAAVGDDYYGDAAIRPDPSAVDASAASDGDLDLDAIVYCTPSEVAMLLECLQSTCPDGGDALTLLMSLATPECIDCVLAASDGDLEAAASSCVDTEAAGLEGGAPSLPF